MLQNMNIKILYIGNLIQNDDLRAKFMKFMDILTDIQRYQLLLDTAQIGWYEAHFTPGHFICSDFVVRMFGLENEILTFEKFRQMIHEDYRNRITFEFATVKETDVYEQIFPIHTRYGIKWFRSKICRRTVDDCGNVSALGLLELIPSQQKGNLSVRERDTVNHLLEHFGSLSRALMSFARMGNLEVAINKVLAEVLNSLETRGRVYIMRYDYDKRTLNCPYELCSPGVSPYDIANLSFDQIKWSTEILTDRRPIIINLLDEVPPEGRYECNLMQKMQIASIMLLPMNMKERVYGFMGVDIVDTPRLWTPEDYHWLAAVANLISLCIELFLSEEKAQEERLKLDQANLALDRSEKMLRNIYMNIPIGIELYDRDGYLIDLNNKDMEMFGIAAKEDVLGLNIFRNPVLPENILEKMRRQQPVTFRINYSFDLVGHLLPTRKEGILDLSSKITMLYDSQGELTNYLFINIDNTEKMIAYNRIEEFETFFNLISEYAKVGYAKFNLSSRTGSAVTQWYRNLGEENGTPLEQIIGIYRHIHPEDAADMKNFFERVKEGKATHIRKELRVNDPEGQRWTRVNVMRTHPSSSSEHIEMICINYDITELKENELQRRKAEELDRLKSAFLANMSHEIRTPLNAIVGFSSLLTETDNKEEQHQFMEIIQKNNDLLLQLISDILDLSKIEAGTMEFRFTDVDLVSLLDEMVTSFSIKMPPGVKIRTSGVLQPCIIRADRTRLLQVLSNFINNAIKYTTRGFITLHYDLYPQEIKVSVTDTGEGMSAEVQSHIFDRFYKGDTFKQGTGLGLSICETIVRKLGGNIGVHSTPGKGSCFWFTIPRE